MAHRQVELDERGLEYVLGHLRGVNRLCEQLARVVESVDGKVFTALPDHADIDRIYDFVEGGLLKANLDTSLAVPLGDGQGALMPVTDLALLRGQLTLETLCNHPGAICVCDDFNPRSSDANARSTPDAFGVGEETYHLLTAQSGLDVIVDVLRFTDNVWHGVAAVCMTSLYIPADRHVDPETLAGCAGSVVELTCTAYDREGFVAWRREDL